jgi:hypothetical protein
VFRYLAYANTGQVHVDILARPSSGAEIQVCCYEGEWKMSARLEGVRVCAIVHVSLCVSVCMCV